MGIISFDHLLVSWEGLLGIRLPTCIHDAVPQIFPLSLSTHTHTYIYIYIFFFFHHTTCKSTCDTLTSSAANTVSVAQGGTAIPGTTRLPYMCVYVCVYVYFLVLFLLAQREKKMNII